MEKDGPRQFGLVEANQAEEPSWLFPRAVRPSVFRVLLVILEYGRIT
jgi:hypothetical protein